MIMIIIIIITNSKSDFVDLLILVRICQRSEYLHAEN